MLMSEDRHGVGHSGYNAADDMGVHGQMANHVSDSSVDLPVP